MSIEQDLKDQLEAFARRHGYRLTKNAGGVIDGLLKKNEKYGQPYCPCRVQNIDENVCPCVHVHDDIEKTGHCYCRLFELDEPVEKNPGKNWNDFSHVKIDHVRVEGSTITFTIQNGPIKEVGVNGCQVDALGEVWVAILKSFNERFPCEENDKAITCIMEALAWQQKRKQDRTARGVEGHDKQ